MCSFSLCTIHRYIFGRAVGHLKLLDRKTEQEDRIKEFRKKCHIHVEGTYRDITIIVQQLLFAAYVIDLHISNDILEILILRMVLLSLTITSLTFLFLL